MDHIFFIHCDFWFEIFTVSFFVYVLSYALFGKFHHFFASNLYGNCVVILIVTNFECFSTVGIVFTGVFSAFRFAVVCREEISATHVKVPRWCETFYGNVISPSRLNFVFVLPFSAVVFSGTAVWPSAFVHVLRIFFRYRNSFVFLLFPFLVFVNSISIS